MLQPLCMPALIFLLFSVTHVIVDMYKEQYDRALIEFFIGAIFTLLLNLLCQQGLGIVSWFIISIPFLLMTTIAGILLYSFQVNPATGQPLQTSQSKSSYAYPIEAKVAAYDKNNKFTPTAQVTNQPQTTPTTPTATTPTTPTATTPTATTPTSTTQPFTNNYTNY